MYWYWFSDTYILLCYRAEERYHVMVVGDEGDMRRRCGWRRRRRGAARLGLVPVLFSVPPRGRSWLKSCVPGEALAFPSAYSRGPACGKRDEAMRKNSEGRKRGIGIEGSGSAVATKSSIWSFGNGVLGEIDLCTLYVLGLHICFLKITRRQVQEYL
jgi:hypothetical protein